MWSAIVRLLGPGSPAAVAGLIVAVVVVALDSQSWRSLAHVLQEALEPGFSGFAVPPAGADLNPAGAPVRKPVAIRIVAALHHAGIGGVGSCLALAMGRIPMGTPAMRRPPSCQATAWNYPVGAAVTPTVKLSMAAAHSGQSQDGQLSELLAAQVTDRASCHRSSSSPATGSWPPIHDGRKTRCLTLAPSREVCRGSTRVQGTSGPNCFMQRR